MCGRTGRVAITLFAVAAMIAASGAAGAAEYIVDANHAKASDDNAGTADAPLKTIAKGVALAKAGDTVLVKAGTYPEAVKIASGGEAGKPLTLKAAPGERVRLQREDRKCGITWAAGVGHVVIDGFEVRNAAIIGNEDGIGSAEKGAHHVTIQNCVLVGCVLHLGGQSDCTIRRCVQTGGKVNGVMLNGCTKCTVEECEVFGNGADGVDVTWGSVDCKVLRNYIHNQWFDNHPDGLQIYRNVTNLTVADNLLFNCGQGFMMEEANVGVFRNNVLAGTHNSGILLGHKNTHDWIVEQNTIAFTAYKALIYSGRNTVIRNNVILTGGDNKLIQKAGPDPATEDYNLLWKPEGAEVVYDAPKDQDQHSKFADPKFRSAPPLLGKGTFYIDVWSDKEAAKKSTPGKFYLGGRPLTNHFKVGDHVEVNFDGRVRKVTEVTADYVAFEPPLDKLHQNAWDVVVNWKDKTEFAWDLRLSADSPGRGMGDKGQDVGSNIDIQAYMKGDFDGDGKRDLPLVPKD
jgi:hypothetical protein